MTFSKTRRALGILYGFARLTPILLPFRRAQAPVVIREVLQDLGGAWAKIGQTLALRFDLLDAEICYELAKLLNQMPPEPYAKIIALVRAELGQEPEHVFLVFEHEPFAAASIGQVHRAVLPTGENVAVKVQRPDIEEMLATDVRLMYLIAAIVDLFGILGATSGRELVRQFERSLSEELDFENEARCAATLAKNAEGHRFERHATTYSKYSTKRVLTTTLLDGVPLLELIHRRREDTCEEEADCDAEQPETLGRHLLLNTLRQVFKKGCFHADPHPANIFLLPGGVIGYVDFGIVATLSDTVKDSLAYYAMHLFLGNIERSTQEFLRWVTPSARTDTQAARREILKIAQDYHLSLNEVDGKVSRFSFAAYQISVLAAVRRHHMAISSSIVTVFKTLIAVITVVYQLHPEFDLRRHAGAFFETLVVEDACRWLSPVETMRRAFGLRVRVGRVLDHLESISFDAKSLAGHSAKTHRKIRLYSLLTVGGLVGSGMAVWFGREGLLGWPESIGLPGLLLAAVLWFSIQVARYARKL